MPSITRTIDLASGIKIPISVAGASKTIRTMASFSLTSFECQISPHLVRRLGLPSLGYTMPLQYTSRERKSRFTHHIELAIILGGLGKPVLRYPIRSYVAVETPLDPGIGLVLGLQIMQRGIFTLNNQTFSFSF